MTFLIREKPPKVTRISYAYYFDVYYECVPPLDASRSKDSFFLSIQGRRFTIQVTVI